MYYNKFKYVITLNIGTHFLWRLKYNFIKFVSLFFQYISTFEIAHDLTSCPIMLLIGVTHWDLSSCGCNKDFKVNINESKAKWNLLKIY